MQLRDEGKALDGGPLTGTLLKHAGTYSFFGLLSNIVTLGGLALYTRTLGVEKYGVFAYLQSVILFFSSSTSQWLLQAILRFRSAFGSRGQLASLDQVLTTSIAFYLVMVCLLGLALAFVPAAYLGEPIYKYLLFIALLVLTNTIFTLIQAIYQADLMPGRSSGFNLLRSVSRFVVPGGFLLMSKDLDAFLLSVVIAEVLVITMMCVDLRRNEFSFGLVPVLKGEFAKVLGSFWKYGWPMVGWFFCSQIIGLSDRFVLQYFLGSSAVGKYAPNYNLAAMGISAVTVPLVTATHPLIMKVVNERGEAAKSVTSAIRESTRLYLLVSVPVGLAIYIFRHTASHLILGPAYQDGVAVIGPIVLGMLLWNLSMIGHKRLEILSKTRLMFVFVFVSAVLNVALEIILIPRQGFMGAAVATLLAYSLYAVFVLLASVRSGAWPLPWKTIVILIVTCILVVVFFDASWFAPPVMSLWLFVVRGGELVLFIGFLLLLSGEIVLTDVISVMKKMVGLIKGASREHV